MRVTDWSILVLSPALMRALHRTVCSGGVLVLALGLASCGFALKSTPPLSFDRIYIQAPHARSGVGLSLMQALTQKMRLQVLSAPPQPGSGDMVLELQTEQRERVVVGVNATGQVREVQLRLTVQFKLRNAQGVEFIPLTTLTQQRDMSYTETRALAKEAEERALFGHMQDELVTQLIRRLAAVGG